MIVIIETIIVIVIVVVVVVVIVIAIVIIVKVIVMMLIRSRDLRGSAPRRAVRTGSHLFGSEKMSGSLRMGPDTKARGLLCLRAGSRLKDACWHQVRRAHGVVAQRWDSRLLGKPWARPRKSLRELQGQGSPCIYVCVYILLYIYIEREREILHTYIYIYICIYGRRISNT